MTTHGMSGTRLFDIWGVMKARCTNPNNMRYKYYGKRGVKVCAEWINSFASFKDWALENHYADHLQIDRIDNDGNYEPSNCRWVTSLENIRNRSTTVLYLEKAKEIRKIYSDGGISMERLGKMYNVGHTSIYMIVHNKRWVQ